MKKTFLLKTLLLLCALIVGSTSAWADDVVETLIVKGWGDYTTNSYGSAGTDYIGTGSTTGVSYAMQVFNGSKGQPRGNQSGAANFSCRNTTTYSGYYIKQVKLIQTDGTGDMDGSSDTRSLVYFGTSAYANPNTVAPTGTATVSTEHASGKNTLTWDNTNTSVTYFILYDLKTSGTVSGAKVQITWAPASTDPVITADNVNYAADITSGEITYTINNPVVEKELGASSSTVWISNINVTSTKVTFDMEENTNTSESREGFITLTYDGAADKVVTVTQAAAIAKHTVTWSVNGAETTDEVKEGEAITFPADPADLGGKTFVGWTAAAIDGTTDDAPTFVTSATMGTSDLKYYAVYATQSGSGENGWVETTLASLTATDVFVIVGNNGDTYAMTNDNGTGSAPSASAVTISDGKITSTVADNIKWNISGNATDGYTFYPNGDDENWLYCTNTNNGVRVGTNANKTFNIIDDYLNHEGTGRYVGIYNSQDWRCYTSINSNISGQTFAFYKYTEGTSYSAYCTTVTATATIPAGKEWITFCSTANLDFSEAIEGLKGAYTITAHESQATTLTATKMTGKVKAGTGLLLRAAAVDATNAQAITIPVAATGEEQADNMLKGVTVDTEVQPTDGTNTNLGLMDGEFHPYSAAGTLAAGKAYLQIPTAQMPTAPGAKLYIVFDGETTGISTLDNFTISPFDNNAPMYNLAGQRVNKSYKGVVIVNGKKYINK